MKETEQIDVIGVVGFEQVNTRGGGNIYVLSRYSFPDASEGMLS